MHNFGDIIILALISLFLGFKLFSILGQRKDDEAQNTNQNMTADLAAATASANNAEQVDLQVQSSPEIQIQLFDPTFTKERFLNGAREAYKIILDSYANGDTHTLSDLVNIEMMRKFAYNISIREDKNQTHTLNIVSMEEPAAEDISVEDGIASIKVKFISEIINFVSNDKKKCVSGHKTKVQKTDQIWTFTRPLRSIDPKWTLTEISGELL